LGYEAQVVPFIRDMPEALAKAHLVVGRAGAGAVSELCAVGRPSILVPYPFASGDHQYHNAAALARANAAVCVRNEQATTERLAEELRVLVEAPQKLRGMAAAAKAIGRPEASEVIAQDLLQLGNVDLSEARDVDELDLEGQVSVTPSEVH
jgi:UDP-N-acetylglucosamine--N-acetylmuramyl-(pentapeptide) pyrophosphoryl-undecaprenol N-acetylglucosamine transferase